MANTNEMTAHEEHPIDGFYGLLARTALLERWQKRGATIEYLGA